MKCSGLFLVIMLFSISSVFSQKKDSLYIIKSLKELIKIDGYWNKDQWRSVKAIHLTNYMGQIPAFRPEVHVKMMYDEDNLYVIFKVKDRYVRSVITEFNGPVSTDACVEFFFSPDINLPEQYFNLEINAGGTPLMAYHGQNEHQIFSIEDLEKIEISHSLPGKVEPEITTPVTWMIEYKLPVSILKKYGTVTDPEVGNS